MNAWLLAAGAASFLTLLAHIFGGGKEIARPLLEARDMGRTAKYTNYFCWHIVTIALAAMAAGYFYAGVAFYTDARLVASAPWALAALQTGLAGAFIVLNLAIIVRYRMSPLAMPQWALFGIIFGLAMMGLR